MRYYNRFIAVAVLSIAMILGNAVFCAARESQPAGAEGSGVFKDMGAEHWAYEPVARMAERNVLNGYPDGSFRPQQMVSRSEFAAMLSSAAGPELNQWEQAGFADVPGEAWFRSAVAAVEAYMPGAVERDGKRYFLPHDEATREDVVTALVRALGAGGVFVDPGVIRQKFSDYDDIDPAARTALAWAYQNNLLRGFPDDTIRPRDGVSRAEVAALLYRAFFIDDSIEVLLAGNRIETLNGSDGEYTDLINVLQGKYGNIQMSAIQDYNLEYFARQVELHQGEGPRVLYVFGAIDSKYHNWEADFERNSGAVRDMAGEVARETARLYPQDTVLVMIGHRIRFFFDVSSVYEDKYLTGNGDGWLLERFYAGVMFKNGKPVETWVESH